MTAGQMAHPASGTHHARTWAGILLLAGAFVVGLLVGTALTDLRTQAAARPIWENNVAVNNMTDAVRAAGLAVQPPRPIAENNVAENNVDDALRAVRPAGAVIRETNVAENSMTEAVRRARLVALGIVENNVAENNVDDAIRAVRRGQ